ncbi:ABC transporter permease [Sinomonas sp. G460-2]|uniref:ABC transporter permease n=1 Tax=Sinomonas sp. G460-2 TaxID=3393464 RepID=UPI0039F04978
MSLVTSLVTPIFVKRSMLHALRTPDALVMAIVLPTMLMLLFTYVFGGALERDGGSGAYVNYVVPGIIVLTAGFGASSVAVDVANDMTNGIIERFRTMPLRASAVITGHVLTSLVRNLVSTAVVVAVGLAVGFRPHASALAWLGTIALVGAYILAITYLFAAIGLAASGPEAASGFGFILLFAPYLSSAFVHTSTMPAWLQWVADHQPITPLIETMRGLLMGMDIGANAWWAAAWIALILATGGVWTGRQFALRSGRR